MEGDQRTMTEIISDALRVKGISKEKLAQMTGISERFLELILEEKFGKLPSAPYIRGYLIRIADTLNLNGEEIWKMYLKDNDQVHRSGKKDVLPGNRFVVPKLNLKAIIPIAIALLILIYLAIRIPSFFGTSSLSVENISPEMVVADTNFTVRGTVDPSDRLAINGEVVYPKEDGKFEFPLVLHPGFNTVTFKVKPFLGTEEVTTHQIFYKVATTTPTQ